jgi:glycerol-3-phosphate dehydrogenase subunit B
MAIRNEVLVVGGGLAGLTAAVAATRAGANVRLVSAKQSTLRNASGLVDVLGYTPDGAGPVVDPFDALEDLPETHPYSTVGADAVRDGLALFDDVTGERYRGGHTARNALVPTHGGTVKPTARYPESAAAGLASDDRDALLVGFERLVDFDAPLAADHLAAAGVPFDVRGVTVQFPVELDPDATVTRFADLLDRDPGLDDRSSATSVRTALAEAVEPHLAGAERVGFPAVLGEDRVPAVRAELAEGLDAAVFEVPMGPPSLPGIRLEELFFDALESTGAHVTVGNPVVDYEAADGRIEAVYVDKHGRRTPYHAEEVVLATGGLVGRGVDSDREGVREPVFGCHAPAPGDRYEWFDGAAFGDHPFARFGVQVDDGLRPQADAGGPEFENLRAAGSVLGGYDFAAEKSGSGVSLATGVVAGERAAEAV